MKLIKFDNYDEYKSTQAAANRQKFHNVFAETEELRRIAEDLQGHVPDARRGLCHGVRNGYEVRYLRGRVPGLDLVGTDISETAAAIPNCIVWDMHEVKPEWVGATDFIYSNSWDHSYDPRLLFRRWTECLSDRGRLYVAHTEKHSAAGVTDETKVDVFGCSFDELVGLLRETLILEDVLEIAPRATAKLWKTRLAYLRTGQLRKLLTKPLKSRRISVLVLRKRPASA